MLTIKNLSKTYQNRPVLQSLNLQIHSGEIYGLLGANGAGKTTTINMICHLLKPDSGTITINKNPISAVSKNLIGVAPQENLLYQTLSCEENLDFFAKIYGLTPEERRLQVRNCLKSVNLLERAKSSVETLSGGMQRRLNIAIALVHHPKLLILDEPTTGLDIEARYEIWDLILRLKDQGMTILLTTHFLEEAEHLCHRIGILKEGQILAEGTLEELRQLIPAVEVIILKTSEEEKAIETAQQWGFIHRRYGRNLAFWIPHHLELKELLLRFDGIPIDSIARHPVKLEHIYVEITQNCE